MIFSALLGYTLLHLLFLRILFSRASIISVMFYASIKSCIIYMVVSFSHYLLIILSFSGFSLVSLFLSLIRIRIGAWSDTSLLWLLTSMLMSFLSKPLEATISIFVSFSLLLYAFLVHLFASWIVHPCLITYFFHSL